MHRAEHQAAPRPGRPTVTAARLAALAPLLAVMLQAQALQLVEASDGVSVEAIVSRHEPTRIRIEHAAITDVFGNIQSSQCGSADATDAVPPSPSGGVTGVTPRASPALNPDGDVVVECDRDKGEIYVRPVGDSVRPVNLFVSSATATYTLVLRRADTPADTIVIRDRTPGALRRPDPGSPPPRTGPAPSHIRAMKAMLVAMASGHAPPDLRVEEIGRPVVLWREARFTLLRRYEGRGLVGEVYLLQNVSSAVMRLAEQEFDRPEHVTGVAIEQHQLEPGAATTVYVLQRGAQP